jgi:cell division GTPase FtsZ
MTITVIGVGGGANNVIRHLAELPFASDDVFLISAKTDLAQPKVQHQRATDIFLGPNATRGLGAGGDVETELESACKPGSVEDGHSSRRTVAVRSSNLPASSAGRA